MHHRLTLDLLGGISGGHGAGVLPVQFICGVIGELYSGVCAAVVIIHNYDTRVKRSEVRRKRACRRIFDLGTRQKHE